jgi:ribosome recycling factor
VQKDGGRAKVTIRGHRREANETLKAQLKDKTIAEDDLKRGEQEVQKKTDAAIVEVDKILADKEKEILTI